MDFNGGQVLLSSEAEAYIQALEVFDIRDIGSPRWNQQHEYIEKLNMQAIISASQHEDEFVKESFITYEKIPLLIHDLIATEVWKQYVFPELVELDPETDLLFPIYIVLYHEATVVNLLETMLYHSSACEAAEDNIIDLVDYCYRKLTFLATRMDLYTADKDEPANVTSMLGEFTTSSIEELQRQDIKLNFDISVKTVSILRYITDHLSLLPLSTTTRILVTHDIPILLVQFIESPPWTKEKSGKIMKFVESKWQVVEYADRYRRTKIEGQVWIALYQLLMPESTQSKYEFNSYRKNVLLKLRSHLNEILLDQMPMLCELQKFLEQLSIWNPPAPKKDLLLEQVPEIWNRLTTTNEKKWANIAREQNKKYFDKSNADLRECAKKLADTYSFEFLENLMSDPPKCAVCGAPASKRCSRCQNEWYCRRECQVSHWPKHKKACDLMDEAAKNINSGDTAQT